MTGIKFQSSTLQGRGMHTCMRLAVAFGLSSLAFSAHAQFGLQVGQMSSTVWSQRFQPAAIAAGEFEKFRYAAFGEGYFGNTDCSIAGVFAENGYITETTKDRLLGDIKGDMQISAGYALDIASVNVKLGKTVLAFNAGTMLNANAHISNGNTLGLLLKGNKAYAGQTVTDNDLWGNLSQTRRIGVGAGWDFDKLKVGARLNFIQGVQNFNLEKSSLSLFTETDGTEVTLDADYQLNTTLARQGFFQFNGMGASLDAGVTYNINEKLLVEAAVNGLGMMNWKGNQIADEVSVQWDGISIASLLQDSLPEVIQHQVDSIKELIFPDTVEGKWSHGTPMQIRAGARYAIGENGVVGLTIVYAPGISGPQTPFPVIAASYQHEVVTGLVFGGNAYYGGYDAFGFGAMGKYTIVAGPTRINVLLGSDNVLGFIASNIGRGFSAYGGVGVDF